MDLVCNRAISLYWTKGLYSGFPERTINVYFTKVRGNRINGRNWKLGCVFISYDNKKITLSFFGYPCECGFFVSIVITLPVLQWNATWDDCSFISGFSAIYLCIKKTQMRYEKTRRISELNNPTRVNHDHSFVEKNNKIPERYEIGDILTTTKY